jgi:hypothetical protein
MDKRKSSQATLRWERKKSQTSKVLGAISKLSTARFVDINDVVNSCHILDSNPNSPLLAALHKWCEASKDAVALKSKLQAMWSRMRPPSNMDLHPLPPAGAPLTWSADQSRRSIPGKTKFTVDDFVPLVVDAVVCTGDGCEKKALRLMKPELLGEENHAEEEGKGEKGDGTSGSTTVKMKVKATLRVQDVIYTIEKKVRQDGKQKVTKNEIISYEVAAVDYNKGGVIGEPKSIFRKSKKGEAAPTAGARASLNLLSLYDAVVVRREVVNGFKKVTAFIVPSPSVATAYKTLQTFAGEDEWKRELNASTEILQAEQRKLARVEGEKHYKDEKEAMAVASELLRAIPIAYVRDNREAWLKIGRAMRAVSKDLIDQWATWSAGGAEMVYGRRNCLVEWEKFRPRTSYDGPTLVAARERERVAKEEVRMG